MIETSKLIPLAEARARANAAPAAEMASEPPRRAIVLDAKDLAEREFPARKLLLSPWLPEKGLAMIVASRGIGKTWLALNVGLAVATGGEFLGWQARESRRVLYVDGEMPMPDLQSRFCKILADGGRDLPAPENFRMIASDLQERGIPSLATAEGQAFIDLDVRAADLIIIDNIATLAGTGGENESDAWRPVQEWALRQRAAGRSVLFVHHSNKNGGQRGTSAREDVLDSVLNLTRPPGYDASMGARFECHFTKSRGFYGPDAEPFEAKFDGDRWSTGAIQAGDDLSDLKTFKKAGLTTRDIAMRTGMSKSTVARKLQGMSDDDE